MAIAFDATSNSHQTNSVISWSHTCTGSNGYLLVGVAQGNNVDNVTSVTYNGVTMTQLQLVTPDATSLSHQYLFGLAGPATGTNTVTVNRSASGEARCIGLSYTGVNQNSTPNNSGQDNAASNSPATFQATTASSSAWSVAFYGWQRVPSTSTGLTGRGSSDDGNYKAGDSNGIITSPYSMTYTYAGNAKDDSSTWAVLAPPGGAGAAVSSTQLLASMDVG